ncbi:DUF4262 domain-containing protein [Chitinophaga sp. 22620]|uniref:DUF4262 domain-containing protein n=1 Tax=Chitinophaga sp. 22620 TaxID=3453952 RepID=UPI003F844A69
MSDHNDPSGQEARQAILANIEKFGCHLVQIETDGYLPGFVYTIGLFKEFGHPEIICFGLKPAVMASILNHACDLVKKGENLTINRPYTGFLQGFEIQFLEVDKAYYPDYVGYAGWFYDMTFDFPLLQLIWPDKQQHFPWEPGFNPDWKFKQPLLDRNMDFKFFEERNTTVFTTERALKGDPVLYVYHDEDGAWQFHTTPAPAEKDIKIVGLEEITRLDPSLNELFNLPYGAQAWRASKGDDWEFIEDGNDDEEEEEET